MGIDRFFTGEKTSNSTRDSEEIVPTWRKVTQEKKEEPKPHPISPTQSRDSYAVEDDE